MQHGLFQRNTRQRQIILEELQKLKTHPSAADLLARVRERLPSMSLATVYRNLELLSAAGMARRIEVPGAQARFDGNPEPHDHLRCIECGRIDDLYPPLEVGAPEGHDFRGYVVLDRRLELLGRCPVCQERRAAAVEDDK